MTNTTMFSYGNMRKADRDRYDKLITDIDQFVRKMDIDEDLKAVLTDARNEVEKRIFSSETLPVNRLVMVTLNCSTYDPSNKKKFKGKYALGSSGEYFDIWRSFGRASNAEHIAGISKGFWNKVPVDSTCMIGWSDGQKFHLMGIASPDNPDKSFRNDMRNRTIVEDYDTLSLNAIHSIIGYFDEDMIAIPEEPHWGYSNEDMEMYIQKVHEFMKANSLT